MRTLRTGLAYRAAYVSIAVNLVLASLTFWFALRIGSVAMLAQASHTAADILTSVVVLVGFRVASAPADPEHPQGHGRAESVATVVIAMLLAAIGLEFVGEGLAKLRAPGEVAGSWPIAGFMFAVAAGKEVVFRYTVGIGRRIKSDTVIADAWHHRADALAALMAAGAVVGAIYGAPALDGWFALGIAGIILFTAYRLGREAASLLVGRCPGAGVLATIAARARGVPGVHEVHRVVVHDYGPRRVVSLHALVDPSLCVCEGHRIAERVEVAINDGLAAETTVHVEPNLPDQQLNRGPPETQS